MTELKIDWCSYEAAKYAVEHWHYSKCMPRFKLNFIGVWEDGVFVGALVFGLGAAGATNGAAYGLRLSFDMAELCRVALGEHKTTVSKILSIAVKLLKKKSPGLRLLISFADTREGHHGGIYQAAGWFYVGDFDSSSDTYIVNEKEVHAKTLYMRYGKGGQSIPWLRQNVDPNARRIHRPPKHRYLYPLDIDMRKRIEPLRKPYPKRGQGEIDNATDSNP